MKNQSVVILKSVLKSSLNSGINRKSYDIKMMYCFQTATTLTMALYYLAKNTSCQLLAFDDVADVNHYYLRACIKETLRLSPTGGGHTRKTGEHLILGGYFIPKDVRRTFDIKKFFYEIFLF